MMQILKKYNFCFIFYFLFIIFSYQSKDGDIAKDGCIENIAAIKSVGSTNMKESKMIISKDPNLLQFDVIHKFLSTCYWSEGLSVVRLERAVANSLNIGVYIDGVQIAYARIITDSATYAYLCDVFVVESH